MDDSGTGISVAVVVAHPDDETLWAGGTILQMSNWRWFVGALCRGSDPDRAPRFRRALETLEASGEMADLNDGPEQTPLDPALTEDTILSMLPSGGFDILLTHSPFGEYTRHRRHEETGKAVLALWKRGRLPAVELWMFAYEDGGGAYSPKAIDEAHVARPLSIEIRKRKRSIIGDIYGFAPGSFEYEATPWEEAFWCFSSPAEAESWMREKGGKG